MKNRKSAWSRRRFLQGAGISPVAAGLAAGASARLAGQQTAQVQAAPDNIYAELGVRTLINARGVDPYYSSTLMPDEVHQAMRRASQYFVEIVELQKEVGQRLARFAGTEDAMVSSGAAACIAQATAGCMAGTDPEKIARLPDTTGMKNEVIITRRSVWDRSIALTGAKLVVVSSLADLERSINERTAMMEFEYGDPGPVPLEQAISICKRHGVPFLLDAAAMCPPFERLRFLASLGPDMFCVSGGKGLRGPDCTGILFGRSHLIEAALRNGSPYEGSICRPMKVGKEEIIGVLAAVQWSSKRNYAADCRVWEIQMRQIVTALSKIPGVKAEIFYRRLGNEVPHVGIRWDEKEFKLTRQQCIDALRRGKPQIEVIGEERGIVLPRVSAMLSEQGVQSGPAPLISIVSNTLKPGEEKIIAQRLTDILAPASQSNRA
ncbi:MAG TPA: aminotransferase class V-fold PLP-dependent enzyme [Bryobacterales bacterium]|jgi:L-seryl-tRNA(Ser) seleniumtransferase|nr:aminotransferase class V-fold PLP-dependent enzyme [Bryobacterales bacterium]